MHNLFYMKKHKQQIGACCWGFHQNFNRYCLLFKVPSYNTKYDSTYKKTTQEYNDIMMRQRGVFVLRWRKSAAEPTSEMRVTQWHESFAIRMLNKVVWFLHLQCFQTLVSSYPWLASTGVHSPNGVLLIIDDWIFLSLSGNFCCWYIVGIFIGVWTFQSIGQQHLMSHTLGFGSCFTLCSQSFIVQIPYLQN